MTKLQTGCLLKTKKKSLLCPPRYSLTLASLTASYSGGQCTRRILSWASGTANSAADRWKAGRDAHPSAVCIASIFMKHTSNGSHAHYRGKPTICPIDSQYMSIPLPTGHSKQAACKLHGQKQDFSPSGSCRNLLTGKSQTEIIMIRSSRNKSSKY